jgi:NAD(P)-dependent dehydrogenase (short-subunit alcohol dehydrogenase family)
MRLDGKIVVITGAMGALGQTVTSVFSTSGATLVAADRQVPKELPGGMLGLTADVSNEADVQRLMETVIQKAGRIDCLINLVGGFSMGRVTETDRSLWDRMLTTNLTSAFLLSRAVVPHMLKQKDGRVIHIAARAALDPFPGAAAYLVAKSGLLSLIRILALELAGSGVSVNAVLPTTIDTPANRQSMPTADFGKWVRREAIAELLVFLASDGAAAVNGALIPIGSL